MGPLPVDFYLTGGTALGREYLMHRYSDDLDFFINGSDKFKNQVETIIRILTRPDLEFEILQAEEGFVRIIVHDNRGTLKIDYVNDVPFRSGVPVSTTLYRLTDTPVNILSNKVTALPRLEAKDVADIVYISKKYSFDWTEIISEAARKDMWVNPVEAARILDDFPVQKIDEINWASKIPDHQWFESQLRIIIKDILQGNINSICQS